MVGKGVNLIFAIISYSALCKNYVTGSRFDSDPDEFDTCPHADVIRRENYCTVELSSQALVGKWVSQTCETRTEFSYKHLVRSYTFYSNHTFDLVQVFYEDEFCSSAVYSISASGYLHTNRNSHHKSNHLLTRSTITLHDITAAAHLSRHVNGVCPNATARFWRTHKEYEIYNRNQVKVVTEPEDRNDRATQRTEKKDFLYTEPNSQCLLFALDVIFDELDYLRIYKRPFGSEWRTELFLAKMLVHSAHEPRRPTMSNSFQLPLVLYNRSHHCHFCAAVASSTSMFVPVFHEKPHPFPPVVLRGEWFSERCEPVPQQRRAREETRFELFATRNLRLDSDTGQWELEAKYYSESTCTTLIAEQESYGTFSCHLGSTLVPGANDVDFATEKSFLLLWGSALLRKVREDPLCGEDTNFWEIGIKMEMITPCLNTRFSGLSRRNIMKSESDERSEETLYLGEEEDEESGRPAGFGYPLIRCNQRAVWKFGPPPDSSAFVAANWGLILVGLVVLSEMEFS